MSELNDKQELQNLVENIKQTPVPGIQDPITASISIPVFCDRKLLAIFDKS
jgi:hypothetical protein